MPGTEKHTEETKIMIPRKDVVISKEGHVTIKNPRLLEKLKAANFSEPDRASEASISVGIVVGGTF